MESATLRQLKRSGICAAIGLTSCMAFSVQAEPKPYLGVGIGLLEYSEEGLRDDASLPSFYGRAGVEFIDNVSGELRAGTGMSEDQVDVFGTDVDVELDYFIGAYLRGSLPIHEKIKPYAIIGATEGEITASAGGFSETASENDLSFGFGVDISIDERSDFNIEYMSYLDKDGAEISGLSASIVARF